MTRAALAMAQLSVIRAERRLMERAETATLPEFDRGVAVLRGHRLAVRGLRQADLGQALIDGALRELWGRP